MSDYLIRVRRHADEYRATIREVAFGTRPEDIPTMGPEHVGVAKTQPAAMLAAIAQARLPEQTEPRRDSRYAC